jgi:hypothetical protein
MPEPPARISASNQNYVEIAGKALAIVIVLLPAIGALVRFVALLPGKEVSPRLQVALAAPLAELAGTGLAGILPMVPYVAVYLLVRSYGPWIRATLSARTRRGRSRRLLARGHEASQSPRDELSTSHISVANIVRLSPVLLLAAGLLLFLPEFEVQLFASTTSLLTCLLCVRLIKRESPPFSKVWPPLILLLLLSGVVTGLYGVAPIPSADYRYAHDEHRTNPENGFYFQIGNDSTFLYLVDCRQGRGRLLAVRSDRVAMITFQDSRETRPRGASLWRVLHGPPLTPPGLRPCLSYDGPPTR